MKKKKTKSTKLPDAPYPYFKVDHATYRGKRTIAKSIRTILPDGSPRTIIQCKSRKPKFMLMGGFKDATEETIEVFGFFANPFNALRIVHKHARNAARKFAA